MRTRPLVALVLAACLLPQTGCIGSFALTKKVLDWNRSIGGLVIQEVVFLAFIIIPVYSITVFIDAIALNLIEALTGSNPLGMGEPREVALAEGVALRMERTAHGLVTELRVDGQAPTVRRFEVHPDGVEVRDAQGALVASAERDVFGGIELRGAGGALVASWTAAQVEAAQVALEGGDTAALAHVVSADAVAEAE